MRQTVRPPDLDPVFVEPSDQARDDPNQEQSEQQTNFQEIEAMGEPNEDEQGTHVDDTTNNAPIMNGDQGMALADPHTEEPQTQLEPQPEVNPPGIQHHGESPSPRRSTRYVIRRPLIRRSISAFST